MDPIIVIAGPTATGKTRLSVAMAACLGAEILSADSMQVYRGMDIGTAKATSAEMGGIPHHMLDVADPREPFSAARYVAMADPILQDILRRGKPAILTGGTGLYVDSLILGRTFAPYPSTGKRADLEREADTLGMEAMLSRLRAVDPERAETLHPADRKRILRALEVFEETGKSLSAHDRETQAVPPKYQPVWIGLDFQNRADLYRRVDRRVDQMVEAGLLAEIRRLLDAGVPRTATAMQAIGYKEFFPVLDGAVPMDAAVETLKRETRRYAKRQRTWFRRNPAIHWIVQTEPPDFPAVLSEALAEVPFFRKNP